MRKIIAITTKELGTYFKSPMAYIILTITTIVFNAFFLMIIDQNREASLRDMFKLMEFMFVFIVPLLTMKIFSEDKRAGTLEFLMTCPTKNSEIVLGKYLGSLIFLSIIIALTFIHYFIVAYFGKPDHDATVSGYVGIWLEGALFIAIGTLASSWTKNQIIAAINAYIILFTFYFSITFIKYASATAESLIRYMSFWSHTENLASGLLLTSDLVYFLSSIVFCLILTVLSIQNR